MKIALFSDIHANLPAFEAFLEDLDARKPDAIYCLGDLVGYHVWPNEVVAEIRRRGIATIAGNHDLKVPDIKPVTDQDLALSGKNYAYHIISAEARAYLRSLPASISLHYQFNQTPVNILMVHGSPLSVNEYLVEDLDEAYVLTLMAGADILCAGHSHKPYHRIIKRADGTFAHIINTGSVGKPKDGNPQGGYVLLSVDQNSNTADEKSIEVEFVRFDYDVEASAKAIECSPLPGAFAQMLREAY